MIDSHSHLSFFTVDQVKKIIDLDSGIKKWILGGYDPLDWQRQLTLKEEFPQQIETCFGLHPWFVSSDEFNEDKHFSQWQELSKQSQWLGEMGLDYSLKINSEQKEQQKKIFNSQLSCCEKKPLVLHVVQAHGDALSVLGSYSGLKGFVHGFSGSLQVAEDYIKKGFLLSFGPGVLKENFKKARQSLQALPLDKILIESDAPGDQADQRDPLKSFLDVSHEVAKIKNVDKETLMLQLEKNILELKKV